MSDSAERDGGAAAVHERAANSGERSAHGVQGLHLFGFARARSLRSPFRGTDPVNLRVRYRDIEALVRPSPFEAPDADPDQLRLHQRVLDSALRRGTVLPAPYGIVFRDRRELIRFLEEQYLPLDEGLNYLDGAFEMRVHIAASQSEPSPELHGLAHQVFDALRRSARAALTLSGSHGRLLTAAFLVERGAWVDFVERAEDLDVANPQLDIDITGPWPAYDFVRIAR